MSGDLTISGTGSDILLTDTGAQAITHAGSGSNGLSISSTNNNVHVEGITFAAEAMFADNAITLTSTTSTVTVDDVVMDNGAITVSGITATADISIETAFTAYIIKSESTGVQTGNL